MVNKFCPMCGASNPIRWHVVAKPYRWVLQCKECGVIYEEARMVRK